METFTKFKALVENPHYQDQRRKKLTALSEGMIDEPIVGLINTFNQLPYCFSLQYCYGHFVYKGQNDPHNLAFLPLSDTIGSVTYRIAYIAFCIENSERGRMFLEAMKKITDFDAENIQCGCAEWFWNRQVNSYVLQVEPDRFKFEDKAVLDYREAVQIEKIRSEFFMRLRKLLQI